MSVLLNTALAAAASAGQVLLNHWPRERAVTVKGPRDIVTDADVAAQQVIVQMIAERFPGHALLAEEGLHAADLQAAGPVWIVDPLDGTTNYARKHPGFCVAIAVAEAGAVTVGVTYDPLRQETFYAERGQGAWLRRPGAADQPLRVSRTPDMEDALVGLDWARDPAVRARVLAALGRVVPACRTVRAGGSTALGLAYLAAGWTDAYFNLSPQPWDVAAGSLLVHEAGGQVTAPTGQAWRLSAASLAASNGALHAAFIDTLAL
jgi:myo-inositol-1(or 4)-monophosphatase